VSGAEEGIKLGEKKEHCWFMIEEIPRHQPIHVLAEATST
jgi:hypothetical protein